MKALFPCLLLTGCFVYGDVSTHTPVYNAIPYVMSAEAGVYWDGSVHDDVWYFDAEVSDGDGAYDVVEVWADVYDDRSGTLVESFELSPTGDPIYWTSEWLAYGVYLDPFYPFYSADFVAYDSFDAYDIVTVGVLTY